MKTRVNDKLERLMNAFTPILYENDEQFMRNMKEKKNLPEKRNDSYSYHPLQ